LKCTDVRFVRATHDKISVHANGTTEPVKLVLVGRVEFLLELPGRAVEAIDVCTPREEPSVVILPGPHDDHSRVHCDRVAELRVLRGVIRGQLLLLNPGRAVVTEHVGRAGVALCVIIELGTHDDAIADYVNRPTKSIRAGCIIGGECLFVNPTRPVVPEDIHRTRL